ncbi:S8 family peptidase [Burkholderia pseudomallei]|uniref:S8 family peptidase n=1 Tax=Burkholderia pseudomallei TaxID=28450 RepID=UPI0005720C2C|nr:S8 family peptidase [Burkholderia pseudomallei]AJW56896.1 peptidase [Burkholderia pseudomallei]KIX53087.1 peptidase [Burkholderia pseudomallei]MBF3393830.1 S8 family peptidase [Burkholderia pseudomallei]MBF3400669.1 S8 family peptidase [Burkholderia pseudomallei]MBF3436586.1 S8 family peptidase [Burkholderia pseudomallei]
MSMSILIRTASFKATVLCAALAGLVSAAQAETAAAPQVPGPADAVNQLIVKLRAVKTPPGATAAKAERADVQAVIDRVLAARNARAAGRAFGAAAASAPGNPDDPAAGIRIKRDMSGGATVLSLQRHVSLAQAEALARDFAADGAIEYAEPDARMHPFVMPNDTRYSEQWGYFNPTAGANLPKAWDRTTGSARVVVAVIDTGYRPHADLAANLLPGYDFISDIPSANDGNGRDSDASDPGDWVSAQEDGDPSGPFYGCGASDSSWHGTHVAGTIGAVTNNGVGVAGISWVGKVLPVRVLGKCGGMLSDIADGMRWAAGLPVPGAPSNPNPAKVLNLSLGGYGRTCSSTYQNAINEITSRGANVVVAAGNNGGSVSTTQPANCRGVIAVGAIDSRGVRASFSNTGAAVKISAPGVGILSTLNAGKTSPGVDSYASYSGTSMATPHVAGTVALMLAVNSTLSPSQILQRLQSSARPFSSGSSCSTSTCGAGLLDAGNAVDAAAQ